MTYQNLNEKALHYAALSEHGCESLAMSSVHVHAYATLALTYATLAANELKTARVIELKGTV